MSAYASGARTGLFDQARAKVSVEDLLKTESVKLVKRGKAMRGPCVLCDGGGERFEVKGEKWRCYGCDQHGDVVDLVAALRRLEPVEAVRFLLGGDMPASEPRERAAPKSAPSGPTVSEKVAAQILGEARPFAGTLAEKYLLGRGIAPAVLELAAPNLAYHPFAKHHWDSDAGTWIKAPALVVRVVTPSGPTGGAHVTYIDRATAKKAAFDTAKRMWGPQMDAQGRPGCAWLIGPDGAGDLVAAEGVETGLSMATLMARAGRWARVCAALSLNRLQGGILRDDDGCMDPYDPKPDPAAPAVTWPAPAASPWDEVVVAVDADMSPIKVLARTGRGRPCNFQLNAAARARVCGRLAVAAWKASGAPRVRAIAPALGSDFNDELRRVLARESAR